MIRYLNIPKKYTVYLLMVVIVLGFLGFWKYNSDKVKTLERNLKITQEMLSRNSQSKAIQELQKSEMVNHLDSVTRAKQIQEFKDLRSSGETGLKITPEVLDKINEETSNMFSEFGNLRK